jgi:hypothetical protein
VVTTLRRTSTILPSLAHCILDPSMHQIDHHMFTLCRLYSFRRLVASANAAMQAPTAPPPPPTKMKRWVATPMSAKHEWMLATMITSTEKWSLPSSTANCNCQSQEKRRDADRLKNNHVDLIRRIRMDWVSLSLARLHNKFRSKM